MICKIVSKVVMLLLQTIVLSLTLSHRELKNVVVSGNSAVQYKIDETKKRNHEAFLAKKSKMDVMDLFKNQNPNTRYHSNPLSSQSQKLPTSSFNKVSSDSQLGNYNPSKNSNPNLPTINKKVIKVPSSADFISAALQVELNENIAIKRRKLQGNLRGRNQ